jgi:hypothetical protein
MRTRVPTILQIVSHKKLIPVGLQMIYQLINKLISLNILIS